MDYELAKELKDARFPQNRYFGALWYSDVSHTRLPYRRDDKVVQVEDAELPLGIRIPTLSELIDDLPCKIKYRNDNGLYFVLSKLVPEGYRACYEGLGGGEGIDNELNFTSLYADVAVARLWLAVIKRVSSNTTLASLSSTHEDATPKRECPTRTDGTHNFIGPHCIACGATK